MRLLCLALLIVAAPSAASAQNRMPPPPPPESHQFDFWIGEWDVTTPAGKTAGTNRIERVAKGHGLLENWTSAGGGDGKSLNAYNAATRQWQQFWIGADGIVLELIGGLNAAGTMVLSGQSASAKGPVLNRVSWTPNDDGSVRQLWETSADEGKTWSVAFDGRYVRKK